MAKIKLEDGSMIETTDYVRMRKINPTYSIVEFRDGSIGLVIYTDKETEPKREETTYTDEEKQSIRDWLRTGKKETRDELEKLYDELFNGSGVSNS